MREKCHNAFANAHNTRTPQVNVTIKPERERDGDRWEGWTGGGAVGGRGMDGWTGGRGRNEAVRPSVRPSVGQSFDSQFVKTLENQ